MNENERLVACVIGALIRSGIWIVWVPCIHDKVGRQEGTPNMYLTLGNVKYLRIPHGEPNATTENFCGTSGVGVSLQLMGMSCECACT